MNLTPIINALRQMLINCHFADAQFRSNLPIFQ